MYKNQYISELPINEVKEYFDKLRCNTPWTAEQFADFEMCKERLTVYACKTLEQIEWIPVSERLPEKDVWVLTYCKTKDGYEYQEILSISKYNGKWTDCDDFCDEVIAWRPLPEPYKAESEAAE